MLGEIFEKKIATIKIPIFFTISFVKKRPILDRCQKNLLIIWTSRFELVHCDWAMYFLTKPKLAFLTSIFDYSI